MLLFFFCYADNLLEMGQVMNVSLLSAWQSDSSVSHSSPLDLSDSSVFSFLQLSDIHYILLTISWERVA